MANEPDRDADRGDSTEDGRDSTAIHPEALPPREELDADLEDVINLFTHDGKETDEPDIRTDAPPPL